MVRKEKRDAILAQIRDEMSFARLHKQGKVTNWQKNEQMYYGKKEKTDDARANVGLGRMQEFVHTLLSKVDNPLTFKFNKQKESQLKRVARLNSLKEYDAKRDFWDIKDIAGKKQAIIYGRAIYSYSASSNGGYRPNLQNIDVYDFLIDPSAGGLDVEKGRFMGWYGVVKDRYDLENDKSYIKDAVEELLNGSGNNTTVNQEEINKQNRTFLQKAQTGTPAKELSNPDKFVFWEWVTTFEGKRYYALITDGAQQGLRVEELKDVFASDLWPVWTYASFPDLTEFWTPSYCDYAREIFMAQEVSINQMLDNAEQINKPMQYVDTSAIQNLADLKYRKSGVVKLNGGVDVSRAIKFKETPSIQTPIEVFKILDQIQDRASGVTPGVSGIADTDGRATIYEGNQANAADRFGLFNKTYAFGYQRFGLLYEHGVNEHLLKKEAVEILGPNGVEVERVSRRDIFKDKTMYPLTTESANAELALSEQKRRTQVAFLSALFNRPDVNQKELISVLGEKALVDNDTVRRLLDVKNFGDAEVLSEAARDLEDVLEGEYVKPNRMADASYKQYFVNWVQDHEEDISVAQFEAVVQYIRSLDEIIVENTIRKAREDSMEMMMAQSQGMGTPNTRMRAPGPAQPMQDVIQQNAQ
jgi:hypothetical protein